MKHNILSISNLLECKERYKCGSEAKNAQNAAEVCDQ